MNFGLYKAMRLKLGTSFVTHVKFCQNMSFRMYDAV